MVIGTSLPGEVTSLMLVTSCLLMVTSVSFVTSAHDKHGGIKMGVSNIACDDGVHGVGQDWDGDDKRPFTCDGNKIPVGQKQPKLLDEKRTGDPIHKCLNEKIVYNTTFPVSGWHRPLWPVYGEYSYVPPQRYIHSLEHAAIVFLYHPCSDPATVHHFRKLVRGCIRKHVISASKLVPIDRPFALASWGHAIFMDHFDEEKAIKWIKKHGMKDGSEKDNHKEGQYKLGLKVKAKFVSPGGDAKVCEDYKEQRKSRP